MQQRHNGEHGIALIAALMVMLLMSALMIGFTTIVMSDQRFRGIDKEKTKAFYGAQSGLEKLTVDLGNLFLTTPSPTSAQIANLANQKPTIPDITFTGPAGVTAYGAALVACDNLGHTSCNGAVQNGPYQGLIALKKIYTMDAIAKTTGGGEVHLTRKLEAVAIPVFQFGTFSDVDLSLSAGGVFTFDGRIHTNGNLFMAAQTGSGWSTTLKDKVTAVGDIIRQRMQNGLKITDAGYNGTLKAATAPNTFRTLLATEGSLTDDVGSSPNSNWATVSLSTYNGYLRNGGCPPVGGCATPPRGTGAKRLELPLITVGGTNPDMVRRAPANENVDNALLFGERMFGKVSLRILLSDTPGDITSLPTVTATAPVRLGDDGAVAGYTKDWAAAAPAGGVNIAGTAIPNGGTMTPISRSPGLVLVNVTAATVVNSPTQNISVAGPFAAPFVSPVNLQLDMFTNLANATVGAPVFQTLLCQIMTTTQFQTCSKLGGGNLSTVNAGYYVRVNIGTVAVPNYLYFSVQAQSSGTPKTYTVSAGSMNSAVANTFWMQSNVDQTWNAVTCLGVNSNAVSGGAVVQWQNCSNVPKANKSVASGGAGPGITTNALVGQNVGTIGGYIKIEIQKANLTWQDVTAEILNWGFADKNQEGTICDDPTPNAIIRLQRLRDNGGTCHYSKQGGNGVAISTNSYDYWPNTLFDTREGLLRDKAPANEDVALSGVMHYITIDVANLSKWFKRQAPYGAGSGDQVLLDPPTTGGYSVYISDRRNNRSDGSNNTCKNLATPCETGEYGFEDIVNPSDANGLPDGQLQTGEDFNGNGTLEVYGQYPSFLGALNALPPGAVGPTFNDATKVRPNTYVGRSAAMTSRAYLFRRAVKLVNGSNPVQPGFTVVTENPVYIQGDWNSQTSHSETSVIADAVTLLSSNWNDTTYSYENPYDATQRVRAGNTYRLAIIAGKSIAFPWPSAGNPDMSFGTDGGAHNFLRYLEVGATTTTYKGAIATFYYSRQAVGTFKFHATTPPVANVYSAPNRDYSFDLDFLDPSTLPPLTPMFRDLNALGFTQELRPGK
jgi:hypothetical protein